MRISDWSSDVCSSDLPGVFPPLANSEWVNGKASLTVQIVLHGVTGDLTVNGTHYNGHMPTFKDKLDDAQIAAVVSHIRGSFGNAASPVDAAMVKAARARSAEHRVGEECVSTCRSRGSPYH